MAGLPLVLALIANHQAMAWMLLLLGGITDALDGWMARRAGGGSSWGARLDPLADKLLLVAPLLWLAANGSLPLWAVWLLLARELLISGWRRDATDGAPASPCGSQVQPELPAVGSTAPPSRLRAQRFHGDARHTLRVPG